MEVCLPVLQVTLYGIACRHDARVKYEYNVLTCSSDHVKRRQAHSKWGLVLLPMVLHANKKHKCTTYKLVELAGV